MSVIVFTAAMLLAATPAEGGAVPVDAPAPVGAPQVPAESPPPEQQPAADPAPSAALAPAAATVETASDAPAPDARPETAEPDSIVVTGRSGPPPGDPLVSVNEVSFSATQAVDGALVEPAALAYKKALPDPVRSGVRNFFNNLQEPVVFLNFLIQLKPGKAIETVGRFAINSTIGAAGLVDVAKRKPFRLPRRPNGFAHSLGYYGVKPGAYLFLPIIGPTTVRDLFGRWLDLLVLPLSVGAPFNRPAYAAATVTVRSLDDRAESDERLRALRDGDRNFYSALREDYLKTRQAEIDALRGKPAGEPEPPADKPTTQATTPPPAE